MYIYWILLGLAIATEITGTLSMKWASVSEGNGGFILMLVMISLSYIFLSFAVKKIALGVAYALWEGIGILFITLFSVLLFDESLGNDSNLLIVFYVQRAFTDKQQIKRKAQSFD